MINELCAFFDVAPEGKSTDELAKLVKRSYRKLVLKHHPDRGGKVEEFRKVQERYDLFREQLAAQRGKPPPPRPQEDDSRAAVVLFQEFRELVLKRKDFTNQTLDAMATTADEARWFRHFVQLGHGAGFLSISGFISVVFLDKSITLARMYRAWALNALYPGHPLFNEISRMFCGDLPWRYHYLRERIEKIKVR